MNTSLVTTVAVNEVAVLVVLFVLGVLGGTGLWVCEPGTVPKVKKFLSQCSSLVKRLPMTLP